MNKGLRDTPRSRVATDKFRDEHERIFGTAKPKTERLVQVNGELVPASDVSRETTGLYVVEDIKPYRSTIDGSIISSRSQHRRHLKQHGVVEVGNEKLTRSMRKQPTVNKEDVRRDIRLAREHAINKQYYNKR